MKGLVDDRRGAILVAGLFMAIFTTGCLFYLVGLGEAIAQRERMQDAADAAAFASAVLHARGMNVIALVNMTMAALLAALIVLKLVELAGYIGIGIAAGAAFFTSGASLSAIPPLAQVSINARKAHDAAKPTVHTSLRALRIAARGVRIAMPWVAQARTVHSVVDHYAPPAVVGIAVPGRITLPTRDGRYEDLCRKGGEYVGDLLSVPFADISLAGFTIADFTGGLVDAGSAWFCEAEDGQRPGTNVRREIWHPLLPNALACQEYATRANADPVEHERLCAQARVEKALADAAIDPETGSCVHDCGPDGLYELRATLAQHACAPREQGDHALSKFTWQARSFVRRYAWEDGAWRVAVDELPDSERYTLTTTPQRPWLCRAGASWTWSDERRRGGELVPICDDITPPAGPPIGRDHVVDVTHTEVLQVFRCLEVKTERREIEGEGGGLAASQEEGRQMAPQLIAEGARLGEEDFQVRALVVGEPSSASLAPRPRAPFDRDGERDSDGEAWDAASQLGRISLAQAEFYFDDASARASDLLWSMRWTARLRRFRLPERQPEPRASDDVADAALHGAGEVLGSLEDACEAFAPGDFSCGDIDLSSLSELIAH